MEEVRKGYKKTDIGVIPEDWEVKSVNDVGTSFSYGIGAEAIRYNGVKYIRITDITDDGFFKPLPLCSPSYYNDASYVSPHDILVARTGASVGRSYLYDEKDGKLVYAGFLMKFNVKLDCPKYVFFIMHMDKYYSWVQSNSMRSGQPGLNLEQLKTFQFPVPSVKEQTAIATALSDMDSLISTLNKKIEKKRAIKQGLMQQLLTGKKRLPGFNGEWVHYTIDYLLDLGNGYTPSKTNPAYWNNGTLPWFRMEDIRLHGRILKDSIQHITPQAVKGSGLFPKDSIILSTTATIGEHAWLIADSLANQQFTFLNRKANRCNLLDIKYFFYYCYILGDWCRANINEGGLTAVNVDDLKKYTMLIPPTLAEQTAIATVLSDCDKEISSLEEKRDKYKELKQGMMQQLLTGKIRLF